MRFNWYMMTVIMPLCFTLCIILIIIQMKSFKWYSINIDKCIYNQQRELFCLYGMYIVGAICALQCFLCHISNLFPSWYCIYGMSICVIIYAATKTFLYGFFLERAKCIKSDKSIKKLLPSIVIKYILPIYIATYFCVYLVLCPLTFRGLIIDPTKNENKSIPTACLFDKYEGLVFWFSAVIDIFNSIFFLFLFIFPLYDAIKREENFTDSIGHKLMRKEFIQTMKYNVICSSICSISSVSFLFTMSFAENGNIGHYLWFAGNIDIIINSICTFLMVGSNRRYIHYLLNSFYCITNQKDIDGVFGLNDNIKDNNSNLSVSTLKLHNLSYNSNTPFSPSSNTSSNPSSNVQKYNNNKKQDINIDHDNHLVLTKDGIPFDLKHTNPVNKTVTILH